MYSYHTHTSYSYHTSYSCAETIKKTYEKRKKMKIRMTFTIDEDLAHTLKSTYGVNMSETVNEFLGYYIRNLKDPKARYTNILMKKQSIDKEFNEIVKEVERQSIEGNIQERDEAKKLLEKQKLQHETHLNGLQQKYDLIKETPLWTEFLANYDDIREDIKELSQWAGNFQEEGHKIGVVQLREFFIHFDINYPTSVKVKL